MKFGIYGMLDWLKKPFAWWLYVIGAACYTIGIPVMLSLNGIPIKPGLIVILGLFGAGLGLLAYKSWKDSKDETQNRTDS